MPIMGSEISADMMEHVKRFGGDFSVWCVGTVQDAHKPPFDADRLKDSDDTLIYREAYTPASARAVKDRFLNRRLHTTKSEPVTQSIQNT